MRVKSYPFTPLNIALHPKHFSIRPQQRHLYSCKDIRSSQPLRTLRGERKRTHRAIARSNQNLLDLEGGAAFDFPDIGGRSELVTLKPVG